jgi:hypothetical protein
MNEKPIVGYKYGIICFRSYPNIFHVRCPPVESYPKSDVEIFYFFYDDAKDVVSREKYASK